MKGYRDIKSDTLIDEDLKEKFANYLENRFKLIYEKELEKIVLDAFICGYMNGLNYDATNEALVKTSFKNK